VERQSSSPIIDGILQRFNTVVRSEGRPFHHLDASLRAEFGQGLALLSVGEDGDRKTLQGAEAFRNGCKHMRDGVSALDASRAPWTAEAEVS